MQGFADSESGGVEEHGEGAILGVRDLLEELADLASGEDPWELLGELVVRQPLQAVWAAQDVAEKEPEGSLGLVDGRCGASEPLEVDDVGAGVLDVDVLEPPRIAAPEATERSEVGFNGSRAPPADAELLLHSVEYGIVHDDTSRVGGLHYPPARISPRERGVA